jgi:hypothetical protein
MMAPKPSQAAGKAMGKYAVAESLQEQQLVYQQIQCVWPAVAECGQMFFTV